MLLNSRTFRDHANELHVKVKHREGVEYKVRTVPVPFFATHFINKARYALWLNTLQIEIANKSRENNKQLFKSRPHRPLNGLGVVRLSALTYYVVSFSEKLCSCVTEVSTSVIKSEAYGKSWPLFNIFQGLERIIDVYFIIWCFLLWLKFSRDEE